MARARQLGRLPLLVLGVACSACAAPDAKESSPPGEADPVQDLALILNQPNVGLLLGEVKFVVRDPENPPDVARHEDALREFPLYVAFAQRGVIAILGEQDISERSFGPSDSTVLRQQGVAKIATISLGPDSTRSTFRRNGEVEQVWVSLGPTIVDRVASNYALTIGADRYRVLQGMLTTDIPLDLRTAVQQARGLDATADRTRPFKALVKLDPSDQHWKLAAMDMGPAATGITTDEVDQELRRLGGEAPR